MGVAELERDFLRQLVDTLDSHYRELHNTLSESWADVDERLSAFGLDLLEVPPQAENAFRVDLVVGYIAVTAGQAGLLELGPYQLVVPGNAMFSFGGKYRLQNTDKRILSATTLTAGVPGGRKTGTSGFISLGLFGKEIPPGAIRW
jgi:hypothetical protein